MATATYRITEKKCATCRWWDGQRSVEFRANKPFYVKVEAEAADCMAQKRTPTPGDRCPKWMIWEKIESAVAWNGIKQAFTWLMKV